MNGPLVVTRGLHAAATCQVLAAMAVTCIECDRVEFCGVTCRDMFREQSERDRLPESDEELCRRQGRSEHGRGCEGVPGDDDTPMRRRSEMAPIGTAALALTALCRT